MVRRDMETRWGWRHEGKVSAHLLQLLYLTPGTRFGGQGRLLEPEGFHNRLRRTVTTDFTVLSVRLKSKRLEGDSVDAHSSLKPSRPAFG